MKQFAPACERNQDAILSVLREILPSAGTVLEIGSGTGQHAAYFAAYLPHLVWQPTDLPENFASIRAWAEEAALPNLRAPMELDVYAVYPSRKYLSPKIRLLIDFLVESFGGQQWPA